jgi:DNA repair protein RecO (recombination protein O)
MSIRRTQAVVARTLRYSNSSKIVTLITSNHGRVTVMAKGARRPKSKYGGALEPVTLIDVVYYHRDSRDIQSLSEADIINPWINLKDDPNLWPAAACIVEVAGIQTPREDPSGHAAFDLVVKSLDSLASDRNPDINKHLWRYFIRLLKVSGYNPTLDKCVRCGGKVKGMKVFFSFSEGGVVCNCTEHDNRYGLRVSAGALMTMKSLLNASTEDLHRLKIGRGQGHEVENAILQFLSYHTGSSRPPKSLVYLRRTGDR